MISYERDPQQTIPESSVKIIGLGGAGANMLDRAALDGMTGAEMLCVNTDMRTLSSSVAGEKIQIGKNLTKGLGAGGDPELGLKAVQEAELEIRDTLRGRKMIFICVGLGGGTGSGAAPLITRLAREEGAFVVVFATMPFGFEGQRRRDQAETALNELAVLANALVTFDNGRMGELVLAKQGIHEAFAAADRMISESIKAVTRLVVRPGLINVGLDDLMAALRTTRSRCLFGSGIADGENRSQLALENALTSPLLDKGSLLADATTVLVHICGGESLTLYEVELLMQALSKYVPPSAHVLFGAAVDPAMGESLSVTLVSALPEDKLNPLEHIKSLPEDELLEGIDTSSDEDQRAEEDELASQAAIAAAQAATMIDAPEDEGIMEPSEGFTSEGGVLDQDDNEIEELNDFTENAEADIEEAEESEIDNIPDFGKSDEMEEEVEDPFFSQGNQEAPFAETETELSDEELQEVPWSDDGFIIDDLAESEDEPSSLPRRRSDQTAQGELELDGGPKGKFEGESPNFHDGEDLDIPPFLRKKRK
ncbi:MAG: cell division protein FtsZ [Akkermansiaceae bacterium]